MSFLTLNGWTVPTRNGAPRTERMEIGSRGVSVDGTPYAEIRYETDAWNFETTQLSLTEAKALKRLVAGQGHRWDFEDSGAANAWKYSSTGAGGSATITSATRSTTAPKFGSACLSVPDGGSVDWALGLGSQWTAIVWRNTGSGWALYLETSTGLYYRSGSAVSQEAWFSVASGTFTLYNDSGSTVAFDDLVVLPFDVSSGQAAAFSARTIAWPDCPDLEMSGDVVESMILTVRGLEPPQAAYSQGVVSSAWSNTLESVSFTVAEKPGTSATVVLDSLSDPFADWYAAWSAEDVSGTSWAAALGSGPTLSTTGTPSTGQSTSPMLDAGIGTDRVDGGVIGDTGNTAGFYASGLSWTTGDIHIRMAFKPVSEINGNRLFSWAVGATDLVRGRWLSSTSLSIVWQDTGDSAAVYSATITVSDGDWHLLDIIVEPTGGASGYSRMSVYLDGADVSPSDHTAAVQPEGSGDIGVGCRYNGTLPVYGPVLFFGVRPGSSIDLATHQTHAGAMGV